MKGLKFFLQDVAMLFGLYLILSWTGAKFEWFQWLIIAVGFIVFGSVWANRAMDFTVDYFMKPCDNPNCEACVSRKAESNAN